jgi:hypothetical protein
MNTHDEDRVKQLLHEALPPVDPNAEPARDLWPAVLTRMDARPAMPPWFDWALMGGLLGLAAFFPSAIPVLLYYL